MKLLRFQYKERIYYGVVEKSYIKLIEGNIFEEFEITDNILNLSEIKILPPVLPSKIIAVGLNYKDHSKELGFKIPDEPVIFIKPSTSVIGDGDFIIYPKMTKQLDYEAELALIIKRKCRNVNKKNVKNFILGYTCFNDVTARDLQKKDGQWTRAKSFDTFSPIGPYIVTEDDEFNPMALDIELRLNGKTKQKSNTSNLIFSVYQLTIFISKIMTLLPGDVITTGTPAGVGPMKLGDNVEVIIENIGTLKNKVKR